MKKLELDFVCPACKQGSKIALGKSEFSTFRVKCPACGKTIQLETIKGFRQFKLHPRGRQQVQDDFRNAKKPSSN